MEISATIEGGVWVSIAELAERKGVSRQAILKRVNRLEETGKSVSRRDGRNIFVELASYDRAVGDAGDAAREIGEETRRDLAGTPDVRVNPANGKLRDAQTERAQYESRLKALDYAERTGQLVPVKGPHGIETALIRVTEEMMRDLNAPLNRVTDLMEAAREGEPAFRRALRTMIRDQRIGIATKLARIAGEATDDQASGFTVDIEDDE